MLNKRLESISTSDLEINQRSLLELPTDESVLSNLEEWFVSLTAVQHAALGQEGFHQTSTNAIVDVVGLETGTLVLAKGDAWEVIANATRMSGEPVESWCQTLLEKVVAEGQTFFETVTSEPDVASVKSHFFVAAPVLGSSEEVLGVLFGTRRIEPNKISTGIRRLEAVFVTLIAGIISAGLIRENRQADASRLQMQLEQFASPKLVQAMTSDPGILEAQEREISVLFSDIRGFTGLTARVGAEKTFTMIRNLMNQLTGCILDEEGFIMGYAGDGIAAMWNAPADQPDHAELACWAAVNMQKVMSKLSQFWSFVTGEQLQARIGICTGVAHVGNAGSRWRMNYSALGPCVNLASRLEGANKFFDSSILITESTRGRLFSKFDMRRIGPVRVIGVDDATMVHQILTAESKSNATVEIYETALNLFEQGKFEEALRAIENPIRPVEEIDRATELLRSHILDHLTDRESGPPILRLSSK